jgi:hypothetical protein
MKVAVIFRGLCDIVNQDSKDLKIYHINYLNSIQNIKEHLFECNSDVSFDVYGFGWVDNNSTSSESVNSKFKDIQNVDKVEIKIEQQKSFLSDYSNIKKYNEVLKDACQYRLNCKDFDYSNIDLRSFFQNQFSYAYSISEASSNVDDSIYDLYISLRYDIAFKNKVRLENLNLDKVYIDHQNCHSPVFVGDFIIISKNNIMKKFFNFLKSTYYDENKRNELICWFEYYKKNHKVNGSKTDIPYFSNQSHYTYYLHSLGFDYSKIEHVFYCYNTKTNIQ